MKLHRSCLLVLPLLLLPLLAPSAYADSLGADLSTFAVLGAAAVTNASAGGSAATIITGNLGSATACSGFAPPCTGPAYGIVTGTIYLPSTPGTTLALAQGELTSAFTSLSLLGPGTSISAGGLSGNTLGPGVYSVPSVTTPGTFDLGVNSTLTLSGTGEWVFLMSSTLEIGSGTTVDVSKVGAGSSVYWIVPGTAAELGSNTDFAGNILAYGLVAFDPGATDLCGRAFSQAAGVTFAGVGTTIETGESAVEANQVGGGCGLGSGGGLNGLGGTGGGGGGTPTPEPGTLSLLALFSGIAFLRSKRRRVGNRKMAQARE
jgi:hypothetical protein